MITNPIRLRVDQKEYCSHGHKTSEVGFFRKATGQTVCKACNAIWNKNKYSDLNKKVKYLLHQKEYNERVKNDPEYKAYKRYHSFKTRMKYPEKYKAGLIYHKALYSGKIKRQPCEICGNPKSEGHHTDYSKPLDVKWLCLKHHRMAEDKPIYIQ
jgi:hypothetical protein